MKFVLYILFCFFSIQASAQLMNIETINCSVSKKDREKIERTIEFQSKYYARLFNYENATPLNIRIYGSCRKMNNSRGNLNHTRKYNGFYSIKTKTISVCKKSNYLQTVYHEVNHALIHRIIENPPAWINEGTSEFFETLYMKKEKIVLEYQYKRLKVAQKLIKEQKINLNTFLKLSNEQWSRKDLKPEGYSYTVSYALVLFLHTKHRGKIERILLELKKGNNSIEAIETVYPGGIRSLENDFEKFFENNEFYG